MSKEFDTMNVIEQFPLLGKKFRGKGLHYLDSAASSLKPRAVIDRLAHFYSEETANVHRGAHLLSDMATEAYEGARKNIAAKLGASSEREIIFTKGTTESVNLVARCFCEKFLSKGDKILLTEMEHHSNIVPWQVMAEKLGLDIEAIRIDDEGRLDLGDLDKKLDGRVKLVSVAHCSNALGTINPIAEIASRVHKAGALLFVDAAQSAAFMPLSVAELNCDFLAFSGHKVFGPFGVGILWGRETLLNEMPPYQTGGSMISNVSFEKTTFLSAPHRFEAGTPNVAGIAGLGSDWLYQFDLAEVKEHDKTITAEATERLKSIKGISIVGDNPEKATIVSFNLKGAHPSDVGQILDQQNIAVRAGHHCCQPLMKRLNIPGTVRASFSIYSTMKDVEALYHGVVKAKELLV